MYKPQNLPRAQAQAQALTRAVTGQSIANYQQIIQGFLAKGIPADQITPRENIFTFQTWKALGRYVRKGEHGVKITTFLPIEKTIIVNGIEQTEIRTRPFSATVFHISQTEKYEAKS